MNAETALEYRKETKQRTLLDITGRGDVVVGRHRRYIGGACAVMLAGARGGGLPPTADFTVVY